MLRKINNYINRSISRRIFFFFIPYIILLLVTITLFCFNSFYDTLRREKESSTEILVAQISDNFDHYFKDIKTIMAYISINKDVNQALTQYDKMSVVERYYLNNRIIDRLPLERVKRIGYTAGKCTLRETNGRICSQ